MFESRPRQRGGRTCILLAWVLLGDAVGRGLRKLELLHHLGGQETHCRTVSGHRVRVFYNTGSNLTLFKLSHKIKLNTLFMAKVETTYNELESANVIDIYITRAATNDYFHC